MANSVDPDETASLRAISSGSMLFEKVSVLVYQAESLNYLFSIFQL